jgi:ketosteroid isomerase-like protein
MDMGEASDVVNRYLEAFTTGDHEKARGYVAEDFSFVGPIAQYETSEAFFTGAAGLLKVLRGHQLLRQWEDGDEVCSVFELELESPRGRGSVLTSEWNIVREGRVTSSRLMFDTAAFRALLPV